MLEKMLDTIKSFLMSKHDKIIIEGIRMLCMKVNECSVFISL